MGRQATKNNKRKIIGVRNYQVRKRDESNDKANQ